MFFQHFCILSFSHLDVLLHHIPFILHRIHGISTFCHKKNRLKSAKKSLITVSIIIITIDNEADKLECLRRENLRLKRQLEEKDMIVELLKKVKEFERI
jgi:hypothetical protein